RLKDARLYRDTSSSVLVRLEHPLADEVLAEEIRDIRDDSTSPAAMILSHLLAHRENAKDPALFDAVRWVAQWDDDVEATASRLRSIAIDVVRTGKFGENRSGTSQSGGGSSPIECALAAAILVDRWSGDASEASVGKAVEELAER